LKTEIRSTSGTLIATIDNDHYDPVHHECWIDHVSQRTIDVGIDHTTFGGAVKSSNRRRWNVWEGPKLVGAVISRSGTRWDLYRWKNTNAYDRRVGPIGHVGYTRGQDPVGVGAAFIMLGIC
jgi:hypothetical protein